MGCWPSGTHTWVIPALKRSRQEDCLFEDSLDITENSREARGSIASRSLKQTAHPWGGSAGQRLGRAWLGHFSPHPGLFLHLPSAQGVPDGACTLPHCLVPCLCLALLPPHGLQRSASNACISVHPLLGRPGTPKQLNPAPWRWTPHLQILPWHCPPI